MGLILSAKYMDVTSSTLMLSTSEHEPGNTNWEYIWSP